MNPTTQPTTFGEVMDQMQAMLSVARTVEGFKLPKAVEEQWFRATDALETGLPSDAIHEGLQAIKGLRSILAAFLRNSPAKHFAAQIAEREGTEKVDRYDEDILNLLRKKFRQLEEAVRVETNGTFGGRIAAYKAMKDAIRHADTEQTRRDEKRRQEHEQKMASERAATLAKKKEADEKSAEASRRAAQQQREAALAKRKQLADEARKLFS